MWNYKKYKYAIPLFLLLILGNGTTGIAQQNTYCNPINIDYTYMVYDAHKDISYRSGADPAVVRFKDEYYMFVTRSMGYWHSKDLNDWKFISPQRWYFEGSNAPAAFNYKDSLLYVAGNPSGSMSILFTDDPQKHGWERFGENHSDTILGGYIEGPWMTKHLNKYYLQYAAPGTEFNVYGDGVYTADSPLGPFVYAPNNPFSYKPGGFITGAGHGSTVQGPGDHYWHITSMAMNVNIGWERRIGMFPTYFDKDGLMYSDTRFGDYPHYAPAVPDKQGEFTGWMLLSYKKPIKTSSSLGNFMPQNLVDENIKTFWVAQENNDQQWIAIDLGEPSTIRAVQVNFNDYRSNLYGKIPDLYHQYTISGSLDGKNWTVIVDRSKNLKDVPNDYVELSEPQKLRFIRYHHIHVPTPYLSISDLRVFGNGEGRAPKPVKDFSVARKADKRDAVISWSPQKNSTGYNVLWGIAPDKLYSSWMVYDKNTLELKSLNTDQTYYFAIEAFNENGVSERAKLVPAD